MINVGHDVAESGIYHHKVRLVKDPQGPAFESDPPELLTSPRLPEQSSAG